MTTLGIVLGGGGARGLAHIGVLRALADVDVHPDVLVGVSMGAVVGATYAARPDWLSALQSLDRSALPGHENLVDAEGFDLLRAVVRSAVRMAPKVVSFGVNGYEDFGRRTMAELLGGTPDFADLRMPFAAVATDLAGGRRAVLDAGDVTNAVMASAALPVLTRPLELEQGRYLDGGFADPAPVDVARAMGADVVLMVHVGSAPVGLGEATVDGALKGVLRGLEIGVAEFVQSRLIQADVVVAPPFGAGVSWLSFDRADDLAQLGYDAMRGQLDAVLELLDG
ncbi:patatin-like phospholipase family protein [Euzebya pacifica]|uniref:patatin-like phospholipase family protein n=1 Tax=Euzebya pacifica TaxID=1608957 RepID=UPI0030F5A270